MKKNFKHLSAIIASGLAISALSFTASAESFGIPHSVIMKRQEAAMEDYKDLLESFVSGNNVDYPDDFGGIYFDNKTGITTLCLTDTEDIYDYEKYFDNTVLKIKEVEYSFDYLNEICDFISESVTDNNITTLSVSEKNNTVEISVQQDSDKKKVLEYLESNDISTEPVTFIKNSLPTEYTLDVALSTNVNYAYPGSEMYIETSGGTYVGTVGVNAYNPSTNQYGVITAGHLANINGTSSFKNRSSVIFNNNSGVNCIFGGVCDVAFIPFNSSNSFMSTTTIKNENITTCIYDTQPIVSPYMVGFEVVKYGISTGKKIGVLTDLSKDITYSTGNGSILIDDMIEYEMERAGGDSGAPMGIEYSNGNGLYFMGIHSGGVGNTCYATKYRNIIENLGVVIDEVTQY